MSDTTRDFETIYTPSVTTAKIEDEVASDGGGEMRADGSIPWPGSTYIIRSRETRQIIKVEGGRIVMGDFRWDSTWECVERNGWLGFKDPKYGTFLGYNEQSKVVCVAKEHGWWEDFCVRQKPDGGYVLLMAHYDNWTSCGDKKLRPMGIEAPGTNARLKMMECANLSHATEAWDFVKAG